MTHFRWLILSVIAFLPFVLISSGVTAHENYDSYYDYNYNTNYNYNDRYIEDAYNNRLGTECNFSSISVWVGNVRNGVVVTIDSLDEEVTRCIKNTSWISYFSNFGNSVNLEVNKTTLWVQIVATSTNTEVATSLVNAQWSRLLSNRPSSYISSKYSKRVTRTLPRYTPRKKVVVVEDRYYPYQQPTYQYQQYPQYVYNPPARSYVAGSSLFNTYQMYRSLAYQSNGVKITLTSPDYTTTRSLQSYYYTGLFSDFSGISVSVVSISWGVEVTITSGSTSTIEQIQKIGYALVYN